MMTDISLTQRTVMVDSWQRPTTMCILYEFTRIHLLLGIIWVLLYIRWIFQPTRHSLVFLRFQHPTTFLH